MQRLEFEEAVERILEKDERFDGDAYVLLRDALDFTLKELHDAGIEENRHVSGPELLEGFRRYALREFGPMVTTVLGEWGVQSCEDVGSMVFNLVGIGVFGKTESDRMDDFIDIFDFREAFVEPFEPREADGGAAANTAANTGSGSALESGNSI
ncbi:MAG: Minf_1886 family protein [Verrucomicrobiales bacterium]